MKIALRTQIFALDAGRVLMMRRRKGPNKGLWLGPGGRMQFGEAPAEAARREFMEETGLEPRELLFRGLVTLSFPHLSRMSLQFLYACNQFEGKLTKRGDGEGRMRWKHLHNVYELDMPPANQRWMPHIINLNSPIYQARYTFDEDNQIVEVQTF